MALSLFSERTYEALLREALDRVDDRFDKREGSMMFNALAPAMAELAQFYTDMEHLFSAFYVTTAPRAYLIQRGEERGLAPKAATSAVYMGLFDYPVVRGSRFSCEDLNFYASEDAVEENGQYRCSMTCETPGEVGNRYSGDLLPIEYIPGLTRSELGTLLVAGHDEEDTEEFRRRVLDAMQYRAFGGNRADYRQTVLAMEGVGGVKIQPAWNGDVAPSAMIPASEVASWYETVQKAPLVAERVKTWLKAVYTAAYERQLTTGGCVRLFVLGEEGDIPSAQTIAAIQEQLDPTEQAGEGVGLAPIGHVVRVEAVRAHPITVTLRLTTAEEGGQGTAQGALRSAVEAVIEAYFKELRLQWSRRERLTVRVAHLESRILTECADWVVDLQGTALDGKEENLVLDANEIPTLAEVVYHA